MTTLLVRRATRQVGNADIAIVMHYATLAAIIVAGAVLRLTALNRQSLWFDEIDVVVRAQQPLGTVLRTFVDQGENGPLYNILLALQEMVTNVLRHAYRGDESKPVRLQFVAEPRGIEITLRDQGPPFDPLAAHGPDADAEDLPASPGGFGILIMKAVMESIDYQRDGDWNVLTMMRSVHPATPAARLRS